MMNEFDFIRDLLRPLTSGAVEARALLDDVAVLRPTEGMDLVLTADALVEGVHFLVSDPLGLVAAKALRVNLSDLAAKGAVPKGYMACISWPNRVDMAGRRQFVDGLAQAQADFGVALWGGDTTSTPGPLTVALTLFGDCPRGACPDRRKAEPGDDLWVSGVIGDAVIGLKILQGLDFALDAECRAAAINAYRLPAPRLDLRDAILLHAKASADVSDGLLADVGRIAEASGLLVEIDADAVPLSKAGRMYLSAFGRSGHLELLSGGDDYQVILSAASASARALVEAGFVKIGRFSSGAGIRISLGGAEITPTRLGYTHF